MKTIALLPLRLITQPAQFLKLGFGFLLGNVLLIISAKFNLPLLPVPISLQDITVLFLAYYFGPRLAGSMVLAYFAEGLLGFPVFAGSVAGLSIFFSASAGYLLGFVVAAFVCGALLQNKTSSLFYRSQVFVLGFALIFLCGLSYLTYLYSFSIALAVGFYPFILVSLLKIIAISCATRFIKPLK